MSTPQLSPGSRLLVVVPAWNEAASVGAVVRDIRTHAPHARVLVVDDGSTDRTAEIARAAGASVVRLPINLGVGGAMRAGFRYGVRNDYDVAVQIDGDGQHDARYISDLVAGLSHSDVVIGARFAGTGDYVMKGPRRWAVLVLAQLLGRISRTKLTDPTSGYRAASRKAMRVFAVHYPAEYLGDTVESLVIARRLGLSVSQVPVAMRPRAQGRASQGTLSAGLYLGRASAAIALAMVRRWPYKEI